MGAVVGVAAASLYTEDEMITVIYNGTEYTVPVFLDNNNNRYIFIDNKVYYLSRI